jgi:hypothetical protein
MKRKTTTIFAILAMVMLWGCTYNVNVTQRDVASWANSIYNAQYDDYFTWFEPNAEGKLVLKPGTPEKQKEVLMAKKLIFTELQPLLLIYSSYVESGTVPTGVIITDVEGRIVTLINDLIKEGAK